MKRPKACFIHVFKAGGTTVSDWLISQYPESDCPPNPAGFRENKEDYLSAPRLRGHVYWPDVCDLRDRIFLTMVREPESLLMSALWHMISATVDRRHVPYDSSFQDKLLEEAKTLVGRQRQLGMIRFFIGEELEPQESCILSALENIHVVGLTERMRDSLRLFAWKLGCKAPRNINHARNSGAGALSLPREIREIFREELRWDGFLYEAVRQRFDKDFAALCDLAGAERNIDDYLDQHALAVFNSGKGVEIL